MGSEMCIRDRHIQRAPLDYIVHKIHGIARHLRLLFHRLPCLSTLLKSYLPLPIVLSLSFSSRFLRTLVLQSPPSFSRRRVFLLSSFSYSLSLLPRRRHLIRRSCRRRLRRRRPKERKKGDVY